MLAVSRIIAPFDPAPSGSSIAPQDIETGRPASVQRQPLPRPTPLAGILARPGRETADGVAPPLSAYLISVMGVSSGALLAATGILMSTSFSSKDGVASPSTFVGGAILGSIGVAMTGVTISEGIKTFRQIKARQQNRTPPMTPNTNEHQLMV